MKKQIYKDIVKHYENCFEIHGDSHLGVDWPVYEHTVWRHRVMINVIRSFEKPVTLLDFGCGTAQFLQYLNTTNVTNVDYTGLDISPRYIEYCKGKYPSTKFICGDILEQPNLISTFDYIVMNGVFTEKRENTFEDMWTYFTELVLMMYSKTNVGLAFNLMSKQVDWERQDLFHVSLDAVANWLCKDVSRHFVIRNDYGLYEYTVYVYKDKIYQ